LKPSADDIFWLGSVNTIGRYRIYGFVEILKELYVRHVIPLDEGPPEVTDSPFY
jgi:hypothetical protein